ncbi:hypothetical protein [Kordiimonas sp.]
MKPGHGNPLDEGQGYAGDFAVGEDRLKFQDGQPVPTGTLAVMTGCGRTP